MCSVMNLICLSLSLPSLLSFCFFLLLFMSHIAAGYRPSDQRVNFIPYVLYHHGHLAGR
jgi:hypothetical protein